MTEKKIRCLDCRHYYITWDEFFPYGCRKLGFKSRTSPKNAVFELSTIDCLHFSAKDKKVQKKN